MALGQQVVIENRGGAGGMIGTRDAARATPDGYTLVMLLTGISLGANPGYDVNKDFAPIGLVASTPIIVVTHPSVAANSLTDIDRARQERAGKIFGRHAAGADGELLRCRIVQRDGRHADHGRDL